MPKIHIFCTKIQRYRSCICDWIIIICLLSITAVLESPNREPYYQCVPGWTTETSNNITTYPCGDIKDPELQYPYKPNTITATLLPILTFGPWLFTVIFNILIMYCLDPMFQYKPVLKNTEILLRMVLFSSCGTEVLYMLRIYLSLHSI